MSSGDWQPSLGILGDPLYTDPRNLASQAFGLGGGRVGQGRRVNFIPLIASQETKMEKG